MLIALLFCLPASGYELRAQEGFDGPLGFMIVNQGIVVIEQQQAPELRILSVDSAHFDQLRKKQTHLSALTSLEVVGGSWQTRFSADGAMALDASFWDTICQTQELETLVLKNCRVDSQVHWKDIARKLPRLKRLKLAVSQPAQASPELKNLKMLPALRSLALDAHSYSHLDFQFLSSVPQLKELIIGGYFGKQRLVQTCPRLMQTLKTQRGLETLELHDLILDELALLSLCALPDLNELRLCGCVLDVNHLKYFDRFPGLMRLTISNCPVTGKLSQLKDDAEFYQAFSQLEYLKIVARSGFPINRFQKLQKLKTLCLIDGALSPQELSGLQAGNLTRLDLSHPDFVVTYDTLASSFQQNRIESLRLFLCDLDGVEIEKITAQQNLHSLELRSIHSIDEPSHYFAADSQIRHISLVSLEHSPSISALLRLKKLESLKIGSGGYSLSELPRLNELEKLQSLTLKIQQLKPRDLDAVSQLKRLQQLRLEGSVPTAGLPFLSRLQNLELLDLQEAYFDAGSAQRILTALEKLSKELPANCTIRCRLDLERQTELIEFLNERAGEHSQR